MERLPVEAETALTGQTRRFKRIGGSGAREIEARPARWPGPSSPGLCEASSMERQPVEAETAPTGRT